MSLGMLHATHGDRVAEPQAEQCAWRSRTTAWVSTPPGPPCSPGRAGVGDWWGCGSVWRWPTASSAFDRSPGVERTVRCQVARWTPRDSSASGATS